MIEKNGGTFGVSCDYCPDAVDTRESDFQDAVEDVKARGWRVFKKDGEWHHKCKGCIDEVNFEGFTDESI